MPFWEGKRVLVTGARGFLGKHVVAALGRRGLPPDAVRAPSSREADLRDRAACDRVVQGVDLVIHLAAHVGGIGLNQEIPGQLLFDTALMSLQLMEASRCAGVSCFAGIGSACAYPRETPVPFREEALWDGPPDPITGPYGMAKRLLLAQGQAYRQQYGFEALHLIPVNLYGPGDHFDDQRGHVLPSLVRRFVEAQEGGAASVTVWGTGRATREFLYVEDAAEGVLLACERYRSAEPVNLGSGQETPIRELVSLIAKAVGYGGEVRWDATRPDGQPRRCMDVTKARERFGFRATTPLEVGIDRTVAWYRANR